ncbi:uroporphyrinogen-III C-methyltransferase [Actimicrobium antarcticum]|uniref:Uroporphyrin-3 C-methyltransferase n=1 Tax=Actimicrobium antarcticum TaxID=1051899 RepID=A0ABP7SVQ6_9BURK
MTDLPTSPLPGALPPPTSDGDASGTPTPSNRRASSPEWLVYAFIALLAVLLVAQWWSWRTEMHNLRTEAAQRLQAGDNLNSETKGIVKSLQEGTRELQSKVGVLENRQTEAQSQQLSLEQLYQDLSKNRDDWALAEIEQVLSTASQQLQLAGNVQGALIALQNADRSLSRSDKPQFIVIRRAIAKDIDRLKSLPSLDLTGIALRLDSVIGQIDGMPLLSDEKPAVAVTAPKNNRHSSVRLERSPPAPAARGNAAADWPEDLRNKWNSFASEMWSEISQLIRVRTVETSDALLLSPTQAYYARENLKLRLLNARLALLSRNESAFRNDMIASQDTISKYFDTRARQTQVTQALLKQIQASNLSIDMPTLAESLNAVRNYKAKP